MDAMLLEIPTDLPETTFSCESCPAVQRLERELEKLRAEFRWEVGYWKSQHAAALKPLGDEAFCDGLNRVMFHQYTHQPNEDKPGYYYGEGTSKYVPSKKFI